ncbi:MAG: hypothetical protein PHQ23_04955 [Candidatus Wallbacteria bacterium]|nr:hypothetical protein [Candidatus Wallbacteria bacterium]
MIHTGFFLLILILFFCPVVQAEDLQWEDIKDSSTPLFSQTDAFGKRFELKGLIGRVLVISIGDKKSVVEESLWNSWENLQRFSSKTVFVNVFYPGGVSFSVPRGEVVSRIRKSINQRTKEVIRTAPAARRDFLRALEIHWIIDWERKISARYAAPRHRVVVYLSDRKGRIRGRCLYPETNMEEFFKLVSQVENEV